MIQMVKLESIYSGEGEAITRVVQRALEEAEGRIGTVIEISVRAANFIRASGQEPEITGWEVIIEGTPAKIDEPEKQ